MTSLAVEIRPTACSYDCFDACGILAEVKDGRILRLRGDPDHPVTRGTLCQKVNRYLEERYYRPERIVHPLRARSPSTRSLMLRRARGCIWRRLVRPRRRGRARPNHGRPSVAESLR